MLAPFNKSIVCNLGCFRVRISNIGPNLAMLDFLQAHVCERLVHQHLLSALLKDSGRRKSVVNARVSHTLSVGTKLSSCMSRFCALIVQVIQCCTMWQNCYSRSLGVQRKLESVAYRREKGGCL